MMPILPRQLLWKDFESMDEFFKLDRINEAFFEVFTTLREEPFAVQSDEVKVFNEVYYQMTRMVYETPSPSELDKYVNDIKANLGWNYSAELVMSMAYFMLCLISRFERPLQKFFTKAIYERFNGCLHWKPFKHRFEQLKKGHRRFRYMFPPCPQDAEWFKDKYIHWNEITRDYNFECIDKVISLWQDVESKHEVACMINDSINPYSLKWNTVELARLRRFMEIHMFASESYSILGCSEPSPNKDVETLNNRIIEMEREKAALQGRISELEADNKRLNALLEKKKSKGVARRFTLVEIVDYCKSRVEWSDAKEVVAMLNRLLRTTGTQEDSDLVDSIEEEFRNRRYGTITMNNPQFGGAMYDISNNNNVNIGRNGEESK